MENQEDSVSMFVLRAENMPAHLKQLIKSRGAYWDELFRGWMVLKCHHDVVEKVKEECFKTSIREVRVPKTYMTKNRKAEYMYAIYAKKLKDVHEKEENLKVEIQRYEKELREKEARSGNETYLMRDISLYHDAPSEMLDPFRYKIESDFHKRLKETVSLRREICDLHASLSEIEKEIGVSPE